MPDYGNTTSALAGTITTTNTWTGTQTFTVVPQASENGSATNTGFGTGALAGNTGANQTAFGYGGLGNNPSGGFNVAIGFALPTLTTAVDNVAVGYQTLYRLRQSAYNTALGNFAGYNSDLNGSGSATGDNVYIGFQSGYTNTTGALNVLIGSQSGADSANITGTATFSNNILIGYDTGGWLTSGGNNIAIGAYALENYGTAGLTTGTSNVVIGNASGTVWASSESNNIIIGNNIGGVAGESNVTRIGGITLNNASLKGIGVPGIYGLDNRIAVAGADGGAATVYVTTAGTQAYRISARLYATGWTSGTGTYQVKWTEGGQPATINLTFAAKNTQASSVISVQPDSLSTISAQVLSVATSGGTVNVLCVVERLA